jgi:hypothetical protein
MNESDIADRYPWQVERVRNAGFVATFNKQEDSGILLN